MSDVQRTPLDDIWEYSPSPFLQPQWLDDFTRLLSERAIGTDSEKLLQPKPEIETTIRHFAAEFIPDEAVQIAQVAHIAELMYHDIQGPAIRRDIHTVLNTGELRPEITSYIEAIMTDFPLIADFAREHHETCRVKQSDFIDIKGLVGLVKSTNFESIIIKAALDYSNFEFTERTSKERPLTEKEINKMDRIITTIKTIDAPLLEISGFDALASELLSKAYEWELSHGGNGNFVNEARRIFDELGGRNELGKDTERILNALFPEDELSHQQVTHDQESYEIYFTDGSTKLPPYSDTDYRILARLKSVGSTAKKMHRTFEKRGEIKRPADIVGLTLIAPDNASIEHAIHYIMDQLPHGTEFLQAPSRDEIVHLKGSKEFVDEFTSPYSILADCNLSLKAEVSDTGYEAVKVAFLYNLEDRAIPVEIQLTHEESRRQSRVGLAAHTIFKLTKLLGHNNFSDIDLTDEKLVEMLETIAERKELLSNNRYEIVPASAERASAFRNLPATTPSKLAAVAIHG